MLLTLILCGWALCLFRAGSEEMAARPDPGSGGGVSTLRPSVDLRPVFEKWGLVGRQQGKRGTCSAFTLAGALEFAAANKLHRGECFSVEFLNWGANQVVGQSKDGGFFSDLWKGFAAYGICSESALPYRAEFDPALTPSPAVLAEAGKRLGLGLRHHWIKPWNVKTGLSDEQFLAIKRTLNQGWPVCGGLRWPKQPRWTNAVLQMVPADAVYDGHSVLLVGYQDDPQQPGGGALIFRNSNNDGRDGYMPYLYARTYMNDAVWIDYGSSGITPVPVSPVSGGDSSRSGAR